MNTDLNLETLTINPTFLSVAKIIGMDKATELSRHRGGRRIYIPYTHSDDSDLSSIIGQQEAHNLSQIYGGMRWDVPNSAIRDKKRDQILILLSEGTTASKIAALVKCTERYVYLVKSEYGENKNAC